MRRVVSGLALTFLILTSVAMQSFAQSPAKTELVLPIQVRIEWMTLPGTQPADGGYAVPTHSAVKVERAIDATTQQPYDASPNPFECDLKDLRRGFRLDKNSFLLGEPIVAELRIELSGAGEWTEPIGGNYAARGRDDNFLFLMKRRDDNTWVADPYGPADGLVGGGLGGSVAVRRDSPLSLWNGVQRWAAIEKPGSYDLYCIQFSRRSDIIGRHQALLDAIPAELKDSLTVTDRGVIVDKATGRTADQYAPVTRIVYLNNPPSPVTAQLPEDVRARIPDLRVTDISDYAHFEITIREGTPAQVSEMVDNWTEAAEAPEQPLTPAERIERARQGQSVYTQRRTKAIREAIWFSRQPDFLPFVEKLITGPQVDQAMLVGLSLNPSPRAFNLLFTARPTQILGSLRWLSPVRASEAVPRLIDWLGNQDRAVRVGSYLQLNQWTGQSLGQTWMGKRYDRPTLAEGRQMQPLWRDWWEKNRSSVVLKTGQPSPIP